MLLYTYYLYRVVGSRDCVWSYPHERSRAECDLPISYEANYASKSVLIAGKRLHRNGSQIKQAFSDTNAFVIGRAVL